MKTAEEKFPIISGILKDHKNKLESLKYQNSISEWGEKFHKEICEFESLSQQPMSGEEWFLEMSDLTIRTKQWGKSDCMGDYRGNIIADLKPSLGITEEDVASGALDKNNPYSYLNGKGGRQHAFDEVVRNAKTICQAASLTPNKGLTAEEVELIEYVSDAGWYKDSGKWEHPDVHYSFDSLKDLLTHYKGVASAPQEQKGESSHE